jgi:hypothetical protein
MDAENKKHRALIKREKGREREGGRKGREAKGKD